MDIEQFYDADSRRRSSDELEFGRDWTDANGWRCELSWIRDTGELYLMREPVEPVVSDGLGDEWVQSLPTQQVVVEVLTVVHEVEKVEELLAGWPDAMTGRGSVAWIRSRVSRPGGSGGVGNVPAGEEPFDLPGAES